MKKKNDISKARPPVFVETAKALEEQKKEVASREADSAAHDAHEIEKTDDGILDTEQLAKRWKIVKKTLEVKRMRGKGPKFFRLWAGDRAPVRYRLEEIIAYEKANPSLETAGKKVGKPRNKSFKRKPRKRK